MATSEALSVPIYQTATFRLPSAAAGARYSDSVAPSELYTRWGNPTLKQLEAALSQGEGRRWSRAPAWRRPAWPS